MRTSLPGVGYNSRFPLATPLPAHFSRHSAKTLFRLAAVVDKHGLRLRGTHDLSLMHNIFSLLVNEMCQDCPNQLLPAQIRLVGDFEPRPGPNLMYLGPFVVPCSSHAPKYSVSATSLFLEKPRECSRPFDTSTALSGWFKSGCYSLQG